MSEMVLCIPILLLLSAGTVQFSLLFLSKIHFEYACGESAREFNSGQVSNESFAASVWENLSSYQRFFDKGSIKISVAGTQSFLGGDTTQQLGFIGKYVKGGVFNYGGQQWTVSANCNVAPLFTPLLPKGISFTTQLAVLKHPQ